MSALFVTTKSTISDETTNFVFQMLADSSMPEESILIKILNKPEEHRDIISQLQHLINVVNNIRIYYQSPTNYEVLAARYYDDKNTKFVKYNEILS